jgi:hypothetical protein
LITEFNNFLFADGIIHLLEKTDNYETILNETQMEIAKEFNSFLKIFEVQQNCSNLEAIIQLI